MMMMMMIIISENEKKNFFFLIRFSCVIILILILILIMFIIDYISIVLTFFLLHTHIIDCILNNRIEQFFSFHSILLLLWIINDDNKDFSFLLLLLTWNILCVHQSIDCIIIIIYFFCMISWWWLWHVHIHIIYLYCNYICYFMIIIIKIKMKNLLCAYDNRQWWWSNKISLMNKMKKFIDMIIEIVRFINRRMIDRWSILCFGLIEFINLNVQYRKQKTSSFGCEWIKCQRRRDTTFGWMNEWMNECQNDDDEVSCWSIGQKI